MDKSVIEMSHENKWMTKQVLYLIPYQIIQLFSAYVLSIKQIAMLKNEIIDLEENASSLEKENINLMGHLFDCNNEEFRCIKYISQ